jgi:hypothetical protein
MMQQVRVLNDYDPLASRRLREFMRALQGLPIEPTEGLPFTGGILPKQPVTNPKLLDLAAVSHLVLVKGAATVPTAALEWIGDYGPHELVRNPSALPRAYLIDRARVVPDARAALDTIVSAGFDGHREAVLVGDAAGADTQPLEGAVPSAPHAVRFAMDAPEQVTIDLETDHTALLVLADAYAPGWTVRVDGTPRRLWQVNHLMRGVIVQPGERRADFTYRAPGFALGVAIATLGIVAVGLHAALGRRRGEAR